MKQDFFHDAVITDFQIHDGDIKIQIENVQTEDDLPLESGLLIVRNVSLLLEDDKPTKLTNRRIGLDDGDIFRLRFSEEKLDFTVTWESYSPAFTKFATYSIIGRDILWTPQP